MRGVRFLMAGEISGNLAGGIRKMATHGRSVPEIATYYDLDPTAVRRFLRTPLSKDRWAKGTARPIIAQTATRVRAMIDRGSSDADIAAHLELDPERVRDFRKRLEPVRRNRLTRLRGRTEQERLEQNQSKLPLPKPRRPPTRGSLPLKKILGSVIPSRPSSPRPRRRSAPASWSTRPRRSWPRRHHRTRRGRSPNHGDRSMRAARGR